MSNLVPPFQCVMFGLCIDPKNLPTIAEVIGTVVGVNVRTPLFFFMPTPTNKSKADLFWV